jgi:hypothetical protein
VQQTTTEGNLPPPPLPPPPPPSTNRSKLLVAAIVIVLVVVISVAAYIALANPNGDHGEGGPGPSFLPSSSPSSSPTAVPSVTPTSSPTSTVTSSGYRVGAWANYTMRNLNSTGGTTGLYHIRYSVSEGTNKGVDCWLLKTEQELSGELSGQAYSALTETTYWLDKGTLQGVHYRIEIYSNGNLISLTENDYAPGDVNDIPTAINPTTVVSQETITVPAGTFNCDKAVTSTTDLGNQYVVTVWGNQNVPVVGMVKQDMSQNGVLISSTELTAYGG